MNEGHELGPVASNYYTRNTLRFCYGGHDAAGWDSDAKAGICGALRGGSITPADRNELVSSFEELPLVPPITDDFSRKRSHRCSSPTRRILKTLQTCAGLLGILARTQFAFIAMCDVGHEDEDGDGTDYQTEA